MRYNTGNPVGSDGSSDPRDLYDNAGNLDLAANAPAATWVDRLGQIRKSYAGMEADFSASQADKEERFQQFLLSSGYQDLGDYAAGLEITGRNQVFRKDGELYRAAASTDLPYTTTGVWFDESSKFVSIGDAALRQELSMPGGAELVGFVQDGSGAQPRTLQDKGRDTVSILDFGAIGDGAYHPLSERFSNLALAKAQYPFVTSLAQSIDWAALQAALNTKRLVRLLGLHIVVTDPVVVPTGGGMAGEGSPMWTGGFAQFVDDASGTHILGYGTIPKQYSLKHISKCVNSGGVWANPSAAEPHYAASNSPCPLYEMHDFTYQNAVGATPATVKPFSALIVTEDRGNVTLRDFRVVPYFNGQEGYKDIYQTGLADDCDVGIYMLNSENSNVSNVQVVGYWRAQGILKVSQTAIGDDGNSERDNFIHCKMQGHTGFAVRGNDLHRVVAVTANTVAIKWYASHTFDQTGTLRISGQNRPYTSVTYDAVNDWLVFAMANTAGVVVGNGATIANGNFGSSGTQVRDCTIYDLYHHSRLVSNNVLLGFAVPGKCVEISGEPARAVQFWGCTIQGRDDIMVQQLHSRDSEWYGCYFESQPAFGTVFDGTYNYTLPAGSRHIAVAESTTTAPYPAGGTTNLRMYGCTPQVSSTIDLRPSSPITKPARFSAAGDNGLFLPREVYDDRYALVMNGQNVRYQSVSSLRLRPETHVEIGGNGQAEQYLHSLGASLALSSGTRVRISTGAPGAQTEHYTIDANRIIPAASGKDLGNTFAANTFARSFVTRRYYTATLWDGFGPGSPEGVETASVGSTYRSTTTGKFHTKNSGSGNTGWST
ncbi:hypothetical protein OO256_05540 [Pseudomonas sp. DCB_CB]|uniref:hypothetical protein n=1 Tax=unclassified Pseudomonas TaxID=196821 RepID=UPI002248BE21|nr:MULTISPECIES: hypothetical protein [unclassified Pseudomonas]MCX2689944.1 hypothetical protein [Pseudomonas sp. DCB_BZ]MCX2855567.1 hypothetical protein [Pseudomonas sp. DCB_CB]